MNRTCLILAAACVLSLSVHARAETVRTVKLLHFSNLEGEFASLGCGREQESSVDFSNFLYLLDRERASGDTLVLSAGNTLADSPFLDFMMSQGESGMATVSSMLTRTGAEAFVPGLGEFSIPYRMFLEFLPELEAGGVSFRSQNITCEGKSAGCRILTSNPSRVVELDGLRIGIIPVVGDGIAKVVHPDNLKGISIAEPAAVATEQAVRLRKEEKADIVVAVVNLELERGSTRETMEFIRQVHEIDVVLAGGLMRTDEQLPIVRSANTGSGKLLLAGSPRAPFRLGIVTIQVEKKGTGWRIEDSAASVKRVGPFRRDNEVASILSLAVSEFCSLTTRILGSGTIEPEMKRPEFVQYVMEIMRRRMRCDLAILSSDSIKLGKDIVMTGPVVSGLLRRAFARHEVVTLSASGTDLRNYLNSFFSASASGWIDELFLIGAVREPNGTIKVNGRPLNVRRRYSIATSDYLASGGRKYLKTLLAAPLTRWETSHYFLQELVHGFFDRGIEWENQEERSISLDRNFGPLWLRPLWDLSLSLNGSFTNKAVLNSADYAESQLHQSEILGFNGDGQLYLTMNTRDHKFEEFLRLQYGMTRIGEGDLAETQDLITEEVSYAWASLRNLYGKGKVYVPVPIVKGKLETEFTSGPAPEGQKDEYHHLELTGVIGLEWQFNQKANAGIAYGIRSEVLAPDDTGREGLDAGIQVYYNINTLPLYRWNAVSGITLDSRFELFYSDWGGDNIVKGTGSAKLTATLLGPLSFSAGLDVFLFSSSGNGLAYALDTTVGLNLSWDAGFQRF